MAALPTQTLASADVAQAAALLRAGKLIAFATETVYGLGADARNGAAVPPPRTPQAQSARPRRSMCWTDCAGA